jgi:HEAT repeat protein/flagellar basal body rod protein FlgF
MSRKRLLLLAVLCCSILTCNGASRTGLNTDAGPKSDTVVAAPDPVDPAAASQLPGDVSRRAITDSKRIDPKLAHMAVSRVSTADPRPLLRLDTVLLGSDAWPATLLMRCGLDVRKQDQNLLVEGSRASDLKPALRGALARIQESIERVRGNLIHQRVVGQRGVSGEFERSLSSPPSRQPAQTGILIDVSQGPLVETTQALDVAIDGTGLFVVEYQDGNQTRRLYTRDGRFRLRKDGTVVCRTMPEARLVPEVSLPPETTQVAIAGGGHVLARSSALQLLGERGRIKLTWFEHPERLTLDRPGFLTRTAEAGKLVEAFPTESGLGTLRQGHVETSNIDSLANWSRLCLLEDARQLVIAMLGESGERLAAEMSGIQRLGVSPMMPHRPSSPVVSLKLSPPGIEESESALMKFLRIRGADVWLNGDSVELPRGRETAVALVEYLRFLRKRLDVLAENIANASIGEDATGRPRAYQRRIARMGDDGRAAVMEDTSPPRVTWEVTPTNDKEAGAPEARLIECSNVDLESEMSEADLVSREYRAVREAIQQIGSEAVPALTAIMQDGPADGVGMRLDAALALGEIGREASAATPALLKLLESDDWELREGVTGALLRIAPDSEVVTAAVVQTWSAAARSTVGPRRYRAVLTLGRLGAKAAGAIPLLTELLDDPTSGAARALGQIGETAAPAVPALAGALRRPEAHVRQQAADALGRIGPAARPAIPALLEVMKDRRPEVRWRAAAAIGRIGANENGCIAALAAMLKDEDPQVRDRVAEALGRIGRVAGQAEAQIEVASRATRVMDRIWPLYALARGSERPAAAVLSLANLLVQDEDAACVVACRAVGMLGPLAKPAVPVLAELIGSTDRLVAQAAMEALGELGPTAEEAVPQLTVALTDRNPLVRLRAATTLGQIGEGASPAVPALANALGDQSEQVVAACAAALGRIGPRAMEAAPALQPLMAHESASVRSAVVMTLDQLGCNQPGPPMTAPISQPMMAGSDQDAAEP